MLHLTLTSDMEETAMTTQTTQTITGYVDRDDDMLLCFDCNASLRRATADERRESLAAGTFGACRVDVSVVTDRRAHARSRVHCARFEEERAMTTERADGIA